MIFENRTNLQFRQNNGASKHFSKYLLSDLITDHDYKKLATLRNTDEFIDLIYPQIPRPATKNGVTIIGISGPTCAGKTSFTRALVSYLIKHNYPATHIRFDWFLFSRQRRTPLVDDIAQGKKQIEEVTDTAWDIMRYREILEELKSASRKAILQLNGLYDREHGTQSANVQIRVPSGGYVIVEGVGIHDVNNINLIDCHIRMDVNDDNILLTRAIKRESKKQPLERLSENFLKERFRIMDLYHMRYLRQISDARNTWIVDVSDFNNIGVYVK